LRKHSPLKISTRGVVGFNEAASKQQRDPEIFKKNTGLLEFVFRVSNRAAGTFFQCKLSFFNTSMPSILITADPRASTNGTAGHLEFLFGPGKRPDGPFNRKCPKTSFGHLK